MAEARRVAFNTVPAPPAAAAKKKRREERGNVRFGLRLSEPSDRSHTEYNYSELLREAKKNSTNPDDPFNDDEKERREVEALAKKLEEKYGHKNHRKRKDRMQDLIDMGYGYDDTDPFIDNSEAYDELVPASLTTKYGGFYINTGTLQFRQTSDTEDEDVVGKKRLKSPKKQKLRDGEDRVVKKQRRKDEAGMREKKPRKLKVPKESGVVALNAVKHQKKKRRNHSDTLSLAAMLKKFQKEKEAMKKQETNVKQLSASQPIDQTTKNPASSEYNLAASDQVFSILGSSNENDLLQEAANAMELLGDLDIDQLLAETPSGSPASEPEESSNTAVASSCILPTQSQKQVPQLPAGISAQLEKRIRDLKTLCSVHPSNEAHVGNVSSEGEGKKKFFTSDINTILLDIELQVQELNLTYRSGVYSYLASFLPCSKDTLMKRLKKLHLNEQDDRLRDPTQRLKEAVANAMPAQLTKYQEELQAHTQARFAKMASEEDRDKNGSEEEDDDKPGRRVMGPRKKFLWNDYVRDLLCNLVKIKLGCYELEQNRSQSVEDYLKTFMETEVKPIWPKGWMQSRMLLKESKKVHNHLTATLAKKKVILAPKPKVKDSSPKKEQKLLGPVDIGLKVLPMSNITPISISSSSCTPNQDTIYLDDSLDEDLTIKPPSLESVSDALSVFSGTSKAPRVSNNSVPGTPRAQLMMKDEKKVVAKVTPLALSPKEATTSPKVTATVPKDSTPSPRVTTPFPRVTTPSQRVTTPPKVVAPSPRVTAPSSKMAAPSPRVTTSSPKASSLSPVPLTFGHLFGHSSSTKKTQEAGRPGITSLIAGYTAPSPQTSKTPSAAKQQQPGMQRLSQSQTQVAKQQPQSSVHHNSHASPSHVTASKIHQNPVVKLSACHLPQMSEKPAIYPSSSTPSAASSSSVSHAVASRTSISPSTSGSYVPKAAPHSGASVQGFKPPFSASSAGSQNSSAGPGGSTTSRQKLSGTSSGSRPPPSASSTSQQQPVTAGKKTSVPQKLASPPGGNVAGKSAPAGAGSRSSSGTSGASAKSSGATGRSSAAASVSACTTSRSSVSSSISVSRTGTLSNSATSRGSPTGAGSRTNVSGGSGTGAQVSIKMLPSLHRTSSASGSSTGIQATSGSTLLANTSPLTLMQSPLNVTNLNATPGSLNTAAAFSMLGSLVPVSLPFQLPLNLLSFAPESAVSTTAPTGSTSVTFQHNFTQNILKGLQPGSAQLSRSSVPAHLQQTYTDGTQNQGDSAKIQRKSQ
ncbi:ubinuclein-2-like [Narcine bancroftii]|uniref:ubinuclein-2-like n=1 Tax=Narcine bancroftii TaxID=1343680 RepID=UPI0038312649